MLQPMQYEGCHSHTLHATDPISLRCAQTHTFDLGKPLPCPQGTTDYKMGSSRIMMATLRGTTECGMHSKQVQKDSGTYLLRDEFSGPISADE